MTSALPYLCASDRRRAEVRRPGSTVNGIDFLEVVDSGASPGERQRILRVHFLKPPSLAGLTVADVHIDGGERIRGITARKLTWEGDVLVVRVSAPGDFSTYTLRLGDKEGEPFAGLDPLLAAVDFSFKVECPADFDCVAAGERTAAVLPEPEIDYLAKDYDSLRQLLLDRMALLMPDWTERSPADTGIALLELLAYVGDHLSYTQDIVAGEAYLTTARRRPSVRRHVTLVDYRVGDGANARTWVQLAVAADVTLPKGTAVLSQLPGRPAVLRPNTSELDDALAAAPETFETMHKASLRAKHNTLRFHLWRQRDCCLPAGATTATLVGDLTNLEKGDVLIFEEVLGRRTGRPEDADPAHRHAVRLTDVERPVSDPLATVPVTTIAWHPEDALPFALPLSATTDAGHGARPIENVSVARGNVVLADHGRTVSAEPVETPGTGRFRPAPLRSGPLTHSARTARTAIVAGRRERLRFDPGAAANAALRPALDTVLPEITLMDGGGTPWLPQRDLLSSDAFAPEFVAEVDDDGTTRLRFGDGEYGRRPSAGVTLAATYRVGNGARGNLGADALSHVVSADPALLPAGTTVRNPIPAAGGTEPELLEHVRQSAPAAFRRLERAVTPEDYTALAERHAQVQRAQATLRWTGSWRTVFLTVDRTGGRPVDAGFEAELRGHLERYRLAGHDLEIDAPSFAALELEIFVCVDPAYFRSDVEQALRAAVRAFFDPDNFTFGQSVFLSELYATVQRVEGVAYAEVRALQRLGQRPGDTLQTGELRVGRLEIARLADDPSFPERGVLRLVVEGGR